ncbi:hypothetical protein CORC01_08338 [Colletotrichum orchidophilum]|uniref:Uncharacterized protein n=1 Tax=Colletotrichum orchidophilum TaxID=1209926 RepID=A0A1G4B535_9PEZI|nr:uncharacterized protein CORC01_08338 [Colletotrichum orchidophilum]OHE96415.1 hypothetical protein CORC01_08338 [Colletotrichum orchidophilum]
MPAAEMSGLSLAQVTESRHPLRPPIVPPLHHVRRLVRLRPDVAVRTAHLHHGGDAQPEFLGVRLGQRLGKSESSHLSPPMESIWRPPPALKKTNLSKLRTQTSSEELLVWMLRPR